VSLVGFSARNHPQQATRDDVDDRRTLRDFFDPLHAEHAFTLDAAASDENALLPRYFTREHDGLAQSWAGERVWCNPPFSAPLLERFVEKAWTEMVDGTCERVVMLLPANRCEQGFWQRHVEPYRDGDPLHGVRLSVRFLPGRMRFGFPASRPRPEKGDRPPFGCVLLIWTRVSGGPGEQQP
jgi:phage N-6-adenine-methyltransferase